MKLRINRTFRDKNNGKLYKAGAVVVFNAERAAELLNDERSLVSEVEEQKKEPEKPKTKKPEPKKAAVKKK